MPNISKIRKAKRVSVLTKKAQCLGKHYKERSCRPLYEKLKNNNKLLAKALSKEKQNNQSLFTQNVQLIAEIQQLNVICNTRNTVIENVLNNSKEILKMLINMTGYITSTISMCQEVAASNTTVRLSAAADGRKKSNRLSTKSPAKGVVKPMVGGHTITKPTINLSRVNMENISRLSDIQEVTTPDRSQEINESRPSLTVSLQSTPLRYENNRTTCRMPERLTISSSRVNATDEQQRRRRNYHSNRMSGSLSLSRNRWSDETPTVNTRHINIASPTIQLKDISNLLRDSQTVNIRRIIEPNRVEDIENQEINDNESNDPLERNIIIPETHINPNNEDNKTHMQISKKDPSVKVNNKVSDKSLNKIPNVIENSRLPQTNTRNWEEEDPLEGPSWLFNNTIPSRDNEPEELNQLHVSDVNNNTSQLIVYDDDSSDAESNTEELSPQSLNESVSNILTLDRNATPADRIGHKSHDENDSNVCELPTRNIFNHKENFNNIDNNAEDDTTNFARFVTLRREHPEITEDFTLMLSRQPIRNMQFDINELRLPNLEESMMNSIGNEIDTEVTAPSPNIADISISAMSNHIPNESEHDQTVIIKLPLSSIEGENESTPQQKKYLIKKNKIAKMLNLKNETNHIKDASIIKDKTKKRNKSRNNRDPSTAKVVLEKLNEYHVKPRTPVDDIESRNTHDHVRDTLDENLEPDESQDSESNMNNSYTSGRPRRRKAPVNLKEPNLLKKLRRN